jgi:hypothetical protein
VLASELAAAVDESGGVVVVAASSPVVHAVATSTTTQQTSALIRIAASNAVLLRDGCNAACATILAGYRVCDNAYA